MQQHFLKIYLKPIKLLLVLALMSIVGVTKANEITRSYSIQWTNFGNFNFHNTTYPSFVTFNSAGYNWSESRGLPVFSTTINVVNPSNLIATVKNERYLPLADIQDKELLPSSFNAKTSIVYEKKIAKAIVSFVPVRKNAMTGQIEQLVSFDITVTYTSINTPTSFQKKANASTSVLATGEWIKIGVSVTGIHALSKSYLKNIGVNLDNVDPRTIKIYGNGAGPLPQQNAVTRFDDLVENAIMVEGESDGVFNDDDKIIFFGRGQQDNWKYNKTTNRYEHTTNIYADVTYYFLTFGGVAGKRILPTTNPNTFNTSVTNYDFLYVHETEQYNLIKSGRQWMGEEFSRVNTKSFIVNMGLVNTAEPLYVRSSVTARSFSPSSFSVSINGTNLLNQNIQAAVANFESTYAYTALTSGIINVNTASINVGYTYNSSVSGSIGWLDYFELQSRNILSQNTPQFTFRDARSIGTGNIGQFSISTATPITVWDITQPHQIKQIPLTYAGGTATFNANTDSLREYVTFTGQQYFTPTSAGKITNQNLHGLPQADLFIITHSAFVNEAQLLAQFHTTKSGLRTHVVTVDQIYNEFSSGAQDLTAIRDFLRMFYKRATTPADLPKYVTLLGRASYDYKNRIANNTNFVPTYESVESFNPVSTYNSDDYLGLLDDDEGNWDSDNDKKETLDLAIGRLPAQDNAQAQQMLTKIFEYVNEPTFGDWKSKLVFVADDEDYNIHQNQSNTLANSATANFKDYNIKKIFIDAYKEENTSGGARNPDAQAEIVRSVEQGAMLINYTGHGGEIGWAAERILNTDDITKWTNGNKLPLFVTATCEFSRFDDPSRTSAGEHVLLNPNGGGIALFTTVRLVNSGSNFALNTFLFNHVGLDSASAFDRKRLGEIMRLTKNDYLSNDGNERNFTLLGDPAIFLAYPSQRIITTKIDNQPVGNIPDTLKAFAKVTISGSVTDLANNVLTSFNGVIYPTVYDKYSTYRTIGNNPESTPANFTMQNNVIYRGKASVVNGLFSYTFIVPKDISYEIGYGKLSYTADNGSIDAIGHYQNIIVGKTADSIAVDNEGPELKLYMNDEKFVYGGITNENPTLIVKLRDANGINITGKGVGRDISMVLNNDITKTTSLNDYYQAKLDSYQEGEVRFLMKDVPQGKNTLKTRAFDSYNNSSDAMIEFVVANSQEMALQHVLNYPNPFTTNTTFHFDHNKAGEPIVVQVQVFTISGKMIKTLQTDVITAGNHFDQLTWDGKDDYGDNIGKGVYIYKVKVKSTTGKTAEEYQKLVILN